MKPTILSIFLLAIFTLFTESSCHKSKPVSPLDQLPPATQTGANTFGCLINGQVFKPKGSSLSGPNLWCAYQYLQDNYDTGYFFQLNAGDLSSATNITGIGIFTNSLAINSGETYKLVSNHIPGQAYGLYDKYNLQGSEIYYTSLELPGELNITKFDSLKQIVSGTFWFNVINNLGDTVKLTNGRFDMHFTR